LTKLIYFIDKLRIERKLKEMSNQEEINLSDLVDNYFDEDYLTKKHKQKKRNLKKIVHFWQRKL
jgi:hypothetical protein